MKEAGECGIAGRLCRVLSFSRSAGKVGMMLETTPDALAAAVPIESADITE